MAPALQQAPALPPRPSVPSLSLTDEQLILDAFQARGLTVKDDMKPMFLEAVHAKALQQSAMDDLAAEQLLNYAISMIPFLMPGMPLDMIEPILAATGDVNTQLEADNISARYLSAITTAQGLAPESVKILAAVKEVSERTMDSHESVSLEADARAIQEFLGQEISPLMEEIARRRPGELPIQFLRRKREEVKSKREQQRRNVQFHLQRIEDGLSRMHEQTYSIYTNHIAAIRSGLDAEDFMLAHDQRVFKAMVEEKSSSILALFDRYGKARTSLVMKQGAKMDWSGDSRCYVSDEGAKDDILVPKVDLKELAIGVKTEGIFTDGKMKDDGRYKYSASSMSNKNYSEQAADRLVEKVRNEIATSVQPAGDVWQKHFTKHLENMQLVVDVVQRHESRYTAKIAEAKKMLFGGATNPK